MASCCNLKRERRTYRECYCEYCEGVEGGQYREELILNVTVFVVMLRGGQYREELILKVIVFVVSVWGMNYREELILHVTVLVVMVCG
jgi:hypothetical protein